MIRLTLGGKGKIHFEPDLMGKLVAFTQMQIILKGENGGFDYRVVEQLLKLLDGLINEQLKAENWADPVFARECLQLHVDAVVAANLALQRKYTAMSNSSDKYFSQKVHRFDKDYDPKAQ